MKMPQNDLCRSDWEKMIEEWIFSERDREILKRNLLDGRTYEQIAEQFDMSTRQIARIIPRLQNQLFKHKIKLHKFVIKLALLRHCKGVFFLLSFNYEKRNNLQRKRQIF